MMDLVAGKPLWTTINPVPAQYPWLDKDENCEVAVIGGGVTGALTALRFASAGIDTVLVAARAVGYGSTSVSAGILEYDAAGSLGCLAQKIGMDAAVRAMQLASMSIDEIERLIPSLNDDADFHRRDCLHYTTNPDEAVALRDEYMVRLHTGFQVELIEGSTARMQYSFPFEAAILSPGLAAEIDPYRFCHAVIEAAQEAGARIYENTRIDNISTIGDNAAREQVLHSTTRHCLHAKKVVIASGFEVAQFTGGLSEKYTSFAMATHPVQGFAGWPNQMIIRSEDDDVYVRQTSDSRILAGGLKSAVIDASGRLGGVLPVPQMAAKKYTDLESRLQAMFPGIRGITSEYRFAGAYASTSDGLPIIGGEAEHPGWYFALCPGESGILWAEQASRLLLMIHQGQPSPDLELFEPHRRSKPNHVHATH